jgi:hypothetical protein
LEGNRWVCPLGNGKQLENALFEVCHTSLTMMTDTNPLLWR